MKQNFFIIGGGVAGLSTAYLLLQQGHGVTLADLSHPGQSTWAGAGILCPLLPWDYDEAVNRLALSGMRAWPEWAAEVKRLSGIDPEYWACGMEVVAGRARDSDTYPLPTSPGERGRSYSPSPLAGEGWGGVEPSPLDAALEWCRRHDFPAESLGGNRLWLPAVAQLRNPRLLAALAAAITAQSGRILPDCEITGLRREGRKAVAAMAGQAEYAADVFVWAGGAWAGQALAGMAPVPHVRPVRGQMLLYAPGSHALEHILYQDGLYLVPRRDGHLLAGSTLEDAGFDASTTPEILQKLHEAACNLLPGLRAHAPVRSWAGLRPGSPDNIPVIDRHPDYDNVWVSSGHFRYGITMAPAGSRLLAELMLGSSPHLDPAPYTWDAALGRKWLKDEVAHD